MTREEARNAAEVMLAYADGKEIESKARECKVYSWEDNSDPYFDWDCFEYRVKVEPKYRPYKDAEEAFAEAKKHGFWVKTGDSHYCIAYIDKDVFILSYDEHIGSTYSFDNLYDFNWADDGTPCAIKEE